MQQDRDRVNRLEEKAHHHWRNGEFKDSKTVFEKALKIAPRMFGMDGTIARVSACQAKASELSDHNGDELIAAEEAEKASSAKKKKKKNKKKGGGAVSRKGGLDLDDDEDSHPAAGGRGDGGGGGSEDEDGAALEDWGAGGKDRAAGREAPGRRGVGGEAWVLDIQRRAPEEEAKEQGVWEVAENSKERKGRKGKGVKPGATIDWANGMGAAALYEHPPGGVGGGVGGDRGAEAGSVEWAGAAARVAHKASPIAAKGRADGAAWRLEEEEGRAGPPVFLHSAAAAGGGASGGEHLPRGDGAVSAGPSGGPSDQKGADPDLENDECVICFEGAKTHIVIPCGHLALCGTCAAFIGTSLAACPVCNIAACAPFSVKMFRT
ncbi:hypothetical protein T484DRAFT_3116030 [Baffinella frigidus]|nr:hypothetical protein T484DRAFT_3116030 [Cryptophyta sp. CCMP2293]